MIRIIPQSNFTMMPNEINDSQLLSGLEKSLWCHINGKPEVWDFSAKNIALDYKETKKAINDALVVLEAAGLLNRNKKSDGTMDYCLNNQLPNFDNRSQLLKACSTNCLRDNLSKRQIVKETNSLRDNLSTYNKTNLLNKNKETNKNNNNNNACGSDSSDSLKTVNEKKQYMGNVWLMDSEYDQLLEIYGDDHWRQIALTKQSAWLQKSGKDYDSHFKGLLQDQWIYAGIMKQKQNQSNNSNAGEPNNSEADAILTFEQFKEFYGRDGNWDRTEQLFCNTTPQERSQMTTHIPLYNADNPNKQYLKLPENYLETKWWTVKIEGEPEMTEAELRRECNLE